MWRGREEEGSEGMHMVTYKFITIMGVSQHAEGGGWHSTWAGHGLKSGHASVSVMQSASQPVRCTSLTVHGGLALVVTSCQADWSDVDCYMLHNVEQFCLEHSRCVSVTTPPSVCVTMRTMSFFSVHTHPPTYTTDMTHASTTHKHTLNSLSPNALHVHM